MRLLLDTNILVPLINDEADGLPRAMLDRLRSVDSDLVVSVASVWEIAIKYRLGKLPLPCSLDHLPAFVALLDIALLSVELDHVLEPVEPPVRTNDPFDRLLVATCAVEGLRLVTLDRKLKNHPLAWKAPAA